LAPTHLLGSRYHYNLSQQTRAAPRRCCAVRLGPLCCGLVLRALIPTEPGCAQGCVPQPCWAGSRPTRPIPVAQESRPCWRCKVNGACRTVPPGGLPRFQPGDSKYPQRTGQPCSGARLSCIPSPGGDHRPASAVPALRVTSVPGRPGGRSTTPLRCHAGTKPRSYQQRRQGKSPAPQRDAPAGHNVYTLVTASPTTSGGGADRARQRTAYLAVAGWRATSLNRAGVVMTTTAGYGGHGHYLILPERGWTAAFFPEASNSCSRQIRRSDRSLT